MKMILNLSILLLGLLLFSGAAMAQPTVSVSDHSLTVDNVTTEKGAVLTVVGPGGYTHMQEIAQGTSASIKSLQSGVYRYEVLSRPGGARLNGRITVGSVAEPSGVDEDVVVPRLFEGELVAIQDLDDNGMTVLDLDSDGATLDLHWSVVNAEGQLYFKEHDLNSGNQAGLGTTNVSFTRQSLVPNAGVGIGTGLSIYGLSIVNASPIINLLDTDGGTNWKLVNDAGRFVLNGNCVGSECAVLERWDVVVVEEGSAENSLVIDPAGVSLLSSRTVKNNIEPVSSSALLEQLAELPIYTWSYANDNKGTKHVGPMAEDFHQRFGFGSDEKRISSLDTGGLALAGIQALQKELDKRDAEIAELRAAVKLLLAKAEAK